MILNGEAGADQAGGYVSEAGDVDGDGFADVLIGSLFWGPGANGPAGKSYLVYGGPALPVGPRDLGALPASQARPIVGAPPEAAGIVAAAGDVDRDGFGDILIGASGATVGGVDYRGRAYLIYGGATRPGLLALASLAPGAGAVIEGAPSPWQLGADVRAAGDVNRDGYADMLVSDFRSPAAPHRAFLIYGGPALPDTIDTASLDGTHGVAITGTSLTERLAASVSGTGDVNGDGFDDMLLGTFEGTTSPGRAYVVLGDGRRYNIRLRIFVDGPAVVLPGDPVIFRLSVANLGPDAAPGTLFRDEPPAGCASVRYTSVATGDARGNSTSGNGGIHDVLELPRNSEVVYDVTCVVAATATGSLRNQGLAFGPPGIDEDELDNDVSLAVTILGNPLFGDAFERGNLAVWSAAN